MTECKATTTTATAKTNDINRGAAAQVGRSVSWPVSMAQGLITCVARGRWAAAIPLGEAPFNNVNDAHRVYFIDQFWSNCNTHLGQFPFSVHFFIYAFSRISRNLSISVLCSPQPQPSPFIACHSDKTTFNVFLNVLFGGQK